MYFSFYHNGNLRAARARFTNLVHNVGGFDRHTFNLGANGITTHIEAERCTPCTRAEAYDIEAAYEEVRAARVAQARLEYFAKVRG